MSDTQKVPLYKLIEPQNLTSKSSQQTLLICDHGGNHIPAQYHNLGVNPLVKQSHIAVDLGTALLTEMICKQLNLFAIIAQYSRLLVDLNRFHDDPTFIRAISDNNIIPGNCGVALSPTCPEKLLRVDQYFTPYHQKITETLTHFEQQKPSPVLISIHSFTPTLQKSSQNQQLRPWHIGVLSSNDRRLADPCLAILRSHLSHEYVGDNMPYSGDDPYSYSVAHHGIERKFKHLTFEIRQDLLATNQAVTKMAHLLCNVLQQIL